MKNNKKIIISILLMLIIITGYMAFTYYNVNTYNKFYIESKPTVKEEIYEEKITELREKYKNDDVVGTISIENTDFYTAIVQGKDNDFYLNHLPDKTYNINGSIFLDYRVNIDESDKLLVFGHSSESYYLPIMIIENYADESYYKDHKYIYIDSIKEEKVYEVFSAYVETSDFDYMKINYKTDEEKIAHYQKLKNNSFYETGVEITKDDEILLVQTCSTLKEYRKYPKKYMLVLAKRIK